MLDDRAIQVRDFPHKIAFSFRVNSLSSYPVSSTVSLMFTIVGRARLCTDRHEFTTKNAFVLYKFIYLFLLFSIYYLCHILISTFYFMLFNIQLNFISYRYFLLMQNSLYLMYFIWNVILLPVMKWFRKSIKILSKIPARNWQTALWDKV